jgi:hypothetical protein
MATVEFSASSSESITNPNTAGVPATDPTRRSLPGTSTRPVRLGIETEFILTANSDHYVTIDVEEFVQKFAYDYNWRASGTYPQMFPYVRDYADNEHAYSVWYLLRERSIATTDGACKLFPYHSLQPNV